MLVLIYDMRVHVLVEWVYELTGVEGWSGMVASIIIPLESTTVSRIY